MPFTRGKIVIISIAAGILVGIVALIQFSTEEERDLPKQITVSLKDVRMKDIDEDEEVMTVDVSFAISNTGEKTLTILRMEYELFADEMSVGHGFMTFEDIPLAGRAPLFPDSSTTIPTDFRLRYSDDVKDVWDLLAAGDGDDGDGGGEEDGQISWSAKGTAEIESAFTSAVVAFESSV